jgi:hypothetical protein
VIIAAILDTCATHNFMSEALYQDAHDEDQDSQAPSESFLTNTFFILDSSPELILAGALEQAQTLTEIGVQAVAQTCRAVDGQCMLMHRWVCLSGLALLRKNGLGRPGEDIRR